jgi:hypothetical protein
VAAVGDTSDLAPGGAQQNDLSIALLGPNDWAG